MTPNLTPKLSGTTVSNRGPRFEQSAELLSRVAVHGRDHVGVQVQGDRDGRMAEHLLHVKLHRLDGQFSPDVAAFEKSEFADDWRELMRLFMVRRTRTFIEANYSKADETGRKYLALPDGRRSYFPKRDPRTAKFEFRPGDPNDQYARL